MQERKSCLDSQASLPGEECGAKNGPHGKTCSRADTGEVIEVRAKRAKLIEEISYQLTDLITIMSGRVEILNDTGGSPIVVLMTVGAERGPVVINVEQTDFPVTRRVEIHSAPYFIRDAVGRSGVAADAANNSVRARSARKGFDKGSGAPAAQP